MQFRKRPVVVEAHQWLVNDDPQAGGFGNDHMADWLGESFGGISDYAVGIDSLDGAYLIVKTVEGSLFARRGDWIIKGVKGEFYPCKPDIFKATYEPLESEDKAG